MVLYQTATTASGNSCTARFATPAFSRIIRVSAIFCVFYVANGIHTKSKQRSLGSNALEESSFKYAPTPDESSFKYAPAPEDFLLKYAPTPVPTIVPAVQAPMPKIGAQEGGNYDRRDPGRWLQCLQDVSAKHDKLFHPWLSDPWFRGKRVLFLDPAEHTNLGDVTLAFGVHRLLSRFGFFRRSITRCKLQQAQVGVTCSPEVYTQHRLGLFHGGGNWGDLYYQVQKVRLNAIGEMMASGMTLVSMPQSYHYNNRASAAYDASQLNESLFSIRGMTAEKAKKRITLTWREQKSFDTASIDLPFVSHLLVPDIAFSVGPFMQQAAYTRNEPREDVDIVFIWRSDNEGKFKSERQVDVVRAWLDELPGGRKITFALEDWSIVSSGRAVRFATGGGHPYDEGTYDAIHAGISTYLNAGRVVITDRLHGSILSLLNFAPHIYVDNKYNKSSNTRVVALTSEACKDSDALGYKKAYSMKEAVQIAVKWLPSIARGNHIPSITHHNA